MKIIKSHDLIYGITFKNVKIYTDENSCIFLSSVDSENNLKMSFETNYFLLKKFKIYDWDKYNDDLIQIKFLAKYSCILSKLIDLSEFNDVELISIDDVNNPDIEWYNDYYNDYYLCINDIRFCSSDEIKYTRNEMILRIEQKLIGICS